MQQDVAQDSMLIKLAFRQRKREMRSVDRNIELFQNVRQRAQMIFMTMREHDRRDLLAVLFKDFEIGNANINAIDALFGKAHAGIENQHLVAIAHQRAVHPELADAAEGNNFEDVSHY